jgi:hypothetical protein
MATQPTPTAAAKPQKKFFDPNALDDDELLPPPAVPAQPRLSTVPTEPQTQSEPAPKPTAEAKAPRDAASDPAHPRKGTQTRTPRAPRKTQSAVRTGSRCEVSVHPSVKAALTAVVRAARDADPTSRVSSATVVMDAIEAHSEQLATHWAVTIEQKPGAIFKRRDNLKGPRRRRHTEQPARVLLSGMVPDDVDALDELVRKWNAGSLSVLVETALRFELLDAQDAEQEQ